MILSRSATKRIIGQSVLALALSSITAAAAFAFSPSIGTELPRWTNTTKHTQHRQNLQDSVKPRLLISQEQYTGPSILPSAPDAVAGGNPFQGLGRPDDPGAMRTGAFGFPTYNGTNYDTNVPSSFSNSWASYGSPLTAPFSLGQASSTGEQPLGSGPAGSALGQESTYVPTSSLDLATPSTNTRNPGAVPLPSPAPNPPGGLFSPGFGGQAGFGATNNTQVGAGGTQGQYNPTSGLTGSAALGSSSSVLDSTAGSSRPEPGFKSLEKTLDEQTPSLQKILKQLQHNTSKGVNRADTARSTTPFMDERDGLGDAVGEDEALAPSISTPPLPEKISKATGMGLALTQMRSRDYRHSVETIRQILKADPGNANAHYLMAVNCVLLKDFVHARQEYESAIKFSHNDELSARARLGLSKLNE